MTVPAKTAVVRTVAAAFLVAATALSGVPSSTAHAAGQYQVRMSGSAFSPRSLTVPAGATVTWTNQDTAPHDVKTSSGPHSFHSAMLNKGDTWSHDFATAGNYSYLCTVHPGMTGQVTVKAAPSTRPPATPSHRHEGAAEHDHAESPAAVPSATSSGSTRAPSPSKTSPAPTNSAPARADQQTVPRPQAAAASRPLQPLLLLTGATAGSAVLCLLLVGSRSAAARRARTEGDGDA
ncbi:plastocyanin/azurin family copper-binding protein [Streptomyces winkii]|uniref:plastocyanin/azurin family copper-binding protein n=1 Tax=Streptomyces winkii TaxID=3051178 RepID=UPI0028D2F778|nr:plastocyanin/azurin family copper-binding protein [Streptomyces sp. DSM 40971]